jgi:putative multiple sugar transport system substrate-binding protein
MSVLQPYIDSKKLVVQSGQMGMDKVGTLRWDGAVAQARMDNLLSAYYGDKRVDAVLSPYDGLSIGILSSLKGVGYGSADQPMPIVSGQDAEVPSIKSMIAGEQYSSVCQGHVRELAKVTANQGRRPAGRQGSCRSTTPRPTTTGVQGGSVLPVEAGQRRPRQLG